MGPTAHRAVDLAHRDYPLGRSGDRSGPGGHNRIVPGRTLICMAAVTALAGGCNHDRISTAIDDDTMAARTRRPAARRAEPAQLPADFELGLRDAWACGDLLLHVANPDRSVMLTVYWPRLLDEATQAEVTRWERTLGGPDGADAAIVVHTGARLDAGTCAREGDEPAVIEQTWNAVAEVGRLGLASADDGGSRLSAWLWDVELRRQDDGATVIVEQLEQLDVELAS